MDSLQDQTQALLMEALWVNIHMEETRKKQKMVETPILCLLLDLLPILVDFYVIYAKDVVR